MTSAAGCWRAARELQFTFLRVEFQLLRGGVEIAFVDDVVPIKNGTGFVARDEHRDSLRYSGADQIPDSGTAQVVKQAGGISFLIDYAGALSGGAPGEESPRLALAEQRHFVSCLPHMPERKAKCLKLRENNCRLSAVEVWPDDLDYFCLYILLDEATRTPSGKRQTRPFAGFWVEWGGKPAFRKSDAQERYYVCIEALHKLGQVPIQKAAAYVAAVVGKGTDRAVEVIRDGYYGFRQHRHLSLELWVSMFFSWRDWVLSSDAFTIGFALARYYEKHGPARMERMAELMSAIHEDPAQSARNAAWREGSENRSGQWNKLEIVVMGDRGRS